MKLDTIQCMDALDALHLISDESVELLLTDIPYNVVNRESNGLRNFDKKDADVLNIPLEVLIKHFVRVTKGSIYVFCSTEQVSDIRSLMVEAGLTTRLCIWEKTNPSPVNGQYLWLSGVECCVFGRKKGAVFNEHCKNTVWRFPNGRGKVHPTEKPIKLFRYIIETSSNEGDVVLDPFVGSGTTAVACQELNRKYVGIEKSAEYVKLAKKRLEQKNLNEVEG